MGGWSADRRAGAARRRLRPAGARGFRLPGGARGRSCIDLKGHEPGRLLLLLALGTLRAGGHRRQAGRHRLGRPLHRRRVHPVPAVPRARTANASPIGGIWAGSIGLLALFGTLAAGPVVTAQRTQAVQVARILAKNAVPGDVVLYCPDQLGPAIAREIRAGRGGVGLKNFTIPTLRAARPGRLGRLQEAQRGRRRIRCRSWCSARWPRPGNHRIWLVYSAEYLTYQNLCPNLRLALAQQRALFVWAAPALSSYEHEELDSFTARRR